MRDIFKAIKESVVANSKHSRETSRRERIIDDVSRQEQRPADNQRDRPRVFEPPPAQNSTTNSPDAGRALSVIGPSLVFKGELTAEEDLLIQGRVEGSINHNAANLTIGARGEVRGDIVANKVIIQGTLNGDVRVSDGIIVEGSARVQGDLRAPRIGMKEGAKFKGMIDTDVVAEEIRAGASRTHGGAASASSSEAHAGKPQTLDASAVRELLESAV